MIKSKLFFANNAFKDWFFAEAGKPAKMRTKDTKVLFQKFDRQDHIMKRIAKEIFNMADKKKKKFVWAGYVNCSIPESHHDAVKALMKDEKNVFYSYNQMLTLDYQISLKYDPDQESFKAVATCYDPESTNFGKALSAFAGDWYSALAVLIYKHFELLKMDWGETDVKEKKAFG